MEDIKRRMDDLGHDGKWAVQPVKGKKGRLSEQFMELDSKMADLESELGSPTAAANRRQPQHRTSSQQAKSSESPSDARRRKRASKALSKPTQRARSSSAPRRTQSDSEVQNAHLLTNAVVHSRTGLVPSTRSQRDGWLSSVAPAFEEAQKRRSSSAQRDKRRRPPPPPRSPAQRQPSPARRSVSASRGGGGTFGTSARQTGWRGVEHKDGVGIATSVEATKQELRRAEARRRRQLRVAPLEPPRVAAKHTVQSRTRLPERERDTSHYTRDPLGNAGQYHKQQRGSRSDLHFLSSLRAPSPTPSERSVRFGDATEKFFDDARSQLSTASEPMHPTSPVIKPHYHDYPWAPVDDGSLKPKYNRAEGVTIMQDVENKIAQMEHDLMLSSSGGSLAIQFTKQQPAAAAAAPTLTLQPATGTTADELEDDEEEEEHGWETHVAISTGRTYYYHTGTGVSTYTHPSDLAAAAGSAPVAARPAATTIASPRSHVPAVATPIISAPEAGSAATVVGRESLAVGETIAVYQNGDVQISTAKPRRAKEWKETGAVSEVDLPALQWVEGLHSFVHDFQKEVAAGTAVVTEGGEYRGCNVREMQEALEVLTSWKAELAGTPARADMHWS